MFIYSSRIWWEGTKDNILESDNEELNDFVFASKMARHAKEMIMEKRSLK
jgi:phospholipid/cholesterol/gamma-HCH transport system ATP-binding protein